MFFVCFVCLFVVVFFLGGGVVFGFLFFFFLKITQGIKKKVYLTFNIFHSCVCQCVSLTSGYVLEGPAQLYNITWRIREFRISHSDISLQADRDS